MVLFSLAGLGTQEEEEHLLYDDTYERLTRIETTNKMSKDLFFHLKIKVSENMKLEVQSGGQFINY